MKAISRILMAGAIAAAALLLTLSRNKKGLLERDKQLAEILEFFADGRRRSMLEVKLCFGTKLRQDQMHAALSRLVDEGYLHRDTQSFAGRSGTSLRTSFYITDLGQTSLTEQVGRPSTVTVH